MNGGMAGGLTYFGVLSAQQSQRRQDIIVELNEANRRLSETLEENAGLHARLLVQAREAGVLDERARLAREIHDTIAQGLTGIVTQLEAAGAADDDPAVRRRHMDTASALARESLTEARRSVDALAPGAARRDATARCASPRWPSGGRRPRASSWSSRPPAIHGRCCRSWRSSLFRVAQEALANVGKHAGAGRAGLTLSYMDDVVVLDVRDDGRGFDARVRRAAARTARASASTGMEQRVRRVGGHAGGGEHPRGGAPR